MEFKTRTHARITAAILRKNQSSKKECLPRITMPRSAFDWPPKQTGPADLRARPGRAAEVRGSVVIPRTRLELSKLKH